MAETGYFSGDVALTRRAAALALVLGIALNACSDTNGSPSASPDQSPAPTAAPPPTTTPETRAAYPAARLASPGERLHHQNPRDLQASYNPGVRGIGAIEAAAGSPVADGMLYTFTLPRSLKEINNDPNSPFGWLAAATKQMAAAGFRNNILIMQPARWNLTTLDSPNADVVTRSYYESLRDSGVTADSLGTVALVPEPLVGNWVGVDATTPSRYPGMVNRQLDLLLGTFPDASAAVMIDLYEANQLLPHLGRVDAKRLSSVGIQAFSNGRHVGFRQEGGALVADVESYLNPNTVAQIMDKLGNTHPIWINTGIGEEGIYSAGQRQAIAAGIVRVVDSLKMRGLDVRVVNAFLENKMGDEGRDFSMKTNETRAVLPNLVNQLAAQNVATSVTYSAAA